MRQSALGGHGKLSKLFTGNPSTSEIKTQSHVGKDDDLLHVCTECPARRWLLNGNEHIAMQDCSEKLSLCTASQLMGRKQQIMMNQDQYGSTHKNPKPRGKIFPYSVAKPHFEVPAVAH